MADKSSEAMLHSGESSPPPPYSEAVTAQPDSGTVYYYPTAPPMDPGGQYIAPAGQYPAGQYPAGQYPAGQYPPPNMPYPQQPKYPPGAAMPPQPMGPPISMQPTSTTAIVYQQEEPRVNTMGSIILSCVVFWCCNCPFGIIAFVLAMIAQSRSDSGDRQGALSLQKTSMLFSFLGIVITIILIIVIFSLS